MRLMTGDMWSAFDSADLFLICTCGVVTRDNRLVMGAGIALEARDRFPGLDKALGLAVQAGDWKASKNAFHYGLLTSGKKLGCFQTKYQWRDPAEMDLIALGMAELVLWCSYHPNDSVHLAYPGIGLGGLSIEQVEPYIKQLPDNVSIWRKP